jgi:uncharacterized protein (UPF0262 family)
MKKLYIYLCLIFIFSTVIVGCDSDPDNTAQDNNTMPIKSCDFDSIADIGILTLNWEDESKICNIMVSKLNRNPPINLLRSLFKLVSLMNTNNLKNGVVVEKEVDIARHVLSIVRLRRQTQNNEAIQSTFSTIYRISIVTKGEITALDLEDIIKNDPVLSDDGLANLAFMLWETRKDQ